jgi:hypothetical protein
VETGFPKRSCSSKKPEPNTDLTKFRYTPASAGAPKWRRSWRRWHCWRCQVARASAIWGTSSRRPSPITFTVGQEAASHAGLPISLANLTEDERTLRDFAFPLIEPAYDRDRWDAVVYEYGQKREFQRNLWVVDPYAYYRELIAANFRSSAGRYNRLNDDVRNDIVRMGPFFYTAHRVIEADHKRQATLELIPDISPPERFNALARVAENNLTIAWVQESLAQRCASYRFALNRLAVSEPEDMATNVDISLTLMQQQIASNQLVQPGPFRPLPVAVAAKPPPVVK